MMQLMVLEASLFLPRAVFPPPSPLMCVIQPDVLTARKGCHYQHSCENTGWMALPRKCNCLHDMCVWAVNSFHCLSIAVQLATCQNLDQVTKFTSLFTYLHRNMLNKKTFSHLLYRIIQSIFHGRSIPFINLHWFIFILKEGQQHFIYSRYPH